MNKDIIDPDNPGSKREKIFSIVILVLIIMAIGGFAIIRSDASFDASFLRGQMPAEEEIVEEEGEEIESEEDGYEEYEEIEQGIAHYQEGSMDGETAYQEEDRDYAGGVYEVEAQAGDGLTHVARRAAENHLEGRNLSAEQMVYVEDYVQKNLDHDTGWLQPDESVEVSEDLIEEAAEQAEELTEDQLQNLGQYT